MDKDDLNNLSNKSDASQNSAGGGLTDLPPLPEAEDETFLPPPAPPQTSSKNDPTSEEPALGSAVTQAAKPSEEISGSLPPLPSKPESADVSSGVIASDASSPEVAGAEDDPVSGVAASATPGESLPAGAPLAGETSAEEKPKKKFNKKAIIGGVIALVLLVGVPLAAFNIDKFRGDTRSSAKTYTEGYIGTTGGCVNGKTERIYRFADGRTETRADGPACSDSSRRYKPSPTSTPKPDFTPTEETQDCSQAQIRKCESRGEVCAPTGNGQGVCVKKTTYVDSRPNPTVTPITGIITITPGARVTPVQSDDPESPPNCIGGGCGTAGIGGGARSCGAGEICRKQTDGCPSGYTEAGGSCEITDSICCAPNSTPAPTRSGGGGGGGTPVVTSRPPNDKKVDDGGGGGSLADAGMCVETRIYTLQNGKWKLTPLSQVGQFASVGDKVRLAVRGNSSQFSKGRFRVNGGTWVATTTKNAAGEFYIEYTLPEAGSYSIEGQVQ